MGIALGARMTRKGLYSPGAVRELLRGWAHFYGCGRIAPAGHTVPTGYTIEAPGRAPGVPAHGNFEAATRVYADLTKAVAKVSRDEQDMLILFYREDWKYDRIERERHMSSKTISERLKSGRRQLYALMCRPQ